MNTEPKIEVTLADGTELVWYSGEETPDAVTSIEEFFGPADEVYKP